MDGIAMDELARTFNFDRAAKPEWSFFGKVDSVESDGTLNVISGFTYDDQTHTATPTTTACMPFCQAVVGDIVMVHVFNGNAVAVCKSGEGNLRAKNRFYIDALTTTAQPYGEGFLHFVQPNRDGVFVRLYAASDGNGDAVLLGDGGLTIVGAGESPQNLYSALVTNGTYNNGNENLILGADGSIELYANCNTIANRTRMIFAGSSYPTIYAYCNATHQMQIGTTSSNGVTDSIKNFGTLQFKDKNEVWAGALSGGCETNGNIRFGIGAHNFKTDGTEVQNWLMVYATKDGKQTYSVSNQANFRSAISAANKPTQLYNNASGTTGTVTLSSSAANFNHIRIYYGYDTFSRTSVDVYDPNGKQVSLLLDQAYDSQYHTYQTTNAVPNGTSITQGSKGHFDINFNGGGAYGYVQDNLIKIYRVEGWND